MLKQFVLILVVVSVSLGQKISKKSYTGTKAASPFTNYGCQCSNLQFVAKGINQGNCKSLDETGAEWCYVNSNSNSCQDKMRSDRYPNRFWSYEACATPPIYGGNNNGNGYGNNNGNYQNQPVCKGSRCGGYGNGYGTGSNFGNNGGNYQNQPVCKGSSCGGYGNGYGTGSNFGNNGGYGSNTGGCARGTKCYNNGNNGNVYGNNNGNGYGNNNGNGYGTGGSLASILGGGGFSGSNGGYGGSNGGFGGSGRGSTNNRKASTGEKVNFGR